jgi:hypothetical protein
LPPAKRIPSPVRAARNGAQRIYDTLAGVEELKAQVAQLTDLRAEVAHLTQTVEALRGEAAADQRVALEALRADHAETMQVLRLIHDDVPANRQRLWRLRQTPEYALAFEEPEPLVSFVVATHTNLETLMERALPSMLAQTYERIEIVIVGDAARPEIGRAVKGVGDPRIRYFNQTLRGPYDEAGERLWYVAGGPPSNEAMRLARGRWIAGMDDDDMCAPERVERLLHAARERDLEFCYGQILEHVPDAPDRLVCRFPPALGAVNLQASILHADLRFIAAELGDALFEVPGDWSRIRRMMRLGVRMGMIDDIVVEYFRGPGWRIAAEPGA